MDQLKSLFEANVDGFLRANGGKTYKEKHHIGAAMWRWMLDQEMVDSELQLAAAEIHYRPGKGIDGHPLWRIAYLRSIRNTPEIDSLFVGKRRGPTPRYARLAAAGLVPKSPKDFTPEASDEAQAVELAARSTVSDAFRSRKEWTTAAGGSEWLYVYSTVRELENHNKHGLVPMLKIGCTRGHYSGRIAKQSRGTAMSSAIVVVDAYRVVDAQALESAVHKALRVQGRHVQDAPGVEWFEVDPAHAHGLISAICGGCLPDTQNVDNV